MLKISTFPITLVIFLLIYSSNALNNSLDLLDIFITQQRSLSSSFKSPNILIEPLHPAGLRISIPHQPGINSVVFNVRFENKLSNEIGTSEARIVGCRWVLVDLTTRLKIGNSIDCTVEIIFNNYKYTVSQKLIVKEWYNIDRNDPFNMGSSDCENLESNINTGEELLPFKHPSPYIVTLPLKPTGVYIYIPHHEGITHVQFYVRYETVNSQPYTKGVANFQGNRWTYRDDFINLNLGSVVYCLIQIKYKGRNYQVSQKHVVKGFYTFNNQEPSNNNNKNNQGTETDNDNGTNSGNNNNNNTGTNNGNNNNNGGNNNKDNGNKGPGNSGNNNGNKDKNLNENNNQSGNNNNKNNDVNIGNNSNNGNSNENESQDCLTQSATTLYDAFGFTKTPCTREIIFYEDFKNLSDFNNKWTVIEQFSGYPDYEFVVYRDSPVNINYDSGLKITPTMLSDEIGLSEITAGELTLQNCTEPLGSYYCTRKTAGSNILPPITSARINTKKAFNFEHGRIQVRAKFPHGDWIYPLIMLEPVRNFKDSPLETLQIRIASSSGNSDLKLADGRDFGGRFLWGGITGLNSSQKVDHINDNIKTMPSYNFWSSAYHIYELIWNPNQLILRVDGEDYGRIPNYLPPKTPFYLTIGVAVGGISEFPDNSFSSGTPKPWRNLESKALYNFFKSIRYESTDIRLDNGEQADDASLNVDFIKVWAL